MTAKGTHYLRGKCSRCNKPHRLTKRMSGGVCDRCMDRAARDSTEASHRTLYAACCICCGRGNEYRWTATQALAWSMQTDTRGCRHCGGYLMLTPVLIDGDKLAPRRDTFMGGTGA